MRIYSDTSTILAYFDENNVFHESARYLFSTVGLEFFTGNITLLELESVISRNLDQFNFKELIENEEKFGNLSPNKKVKLLTEYCLKKLAIKISSGLTIEKITINNQDLDIENTYNLVWKVNADLKLRTLDAIQICSAIKMRIYDKYEIQYFLTNDSTILKSKKEIFQKSKILPISCTDLKNILVSGENA